MTRKFDEARADAELRGESRYLGPSCKHRHGTGDGTFRYTNTGRCVECSRVWTARSYLRWRAKQPRRNKYNSEYARERQLEDPNAWWFFGRLCPNGHDDDGKGHSRRYMCSTYKCIQCNREQTIAWRKRKRAAAG